MRHKRKRLFIAKVDRVLQRAQAKGALGWFNTAFAAERCKNPALNYRAARIRLRNVVASRLWRGLPLSVPILLGEIFAVGEKKPADPMPDASLAEKRA